MPSVIIRKGQRLHRIHAADRAAHWFGRRNGSWRWDDPAYDYGVLYLGRDRIGPFGESLLRDPSQREVLWSVVAQKRWASYETVRALKLADLSGDGVPWFGVTLGQIAGDGDPVTNPDVYATPQRISAEVHNNTSLDGVLYRSRFNPAALCVALFERADAAVVVREQDLAIEKAWAEELLHRQGYFLLDL